MCRPVYFNIHSCFRRVSCTLRYRRTPRQSAKLFFYTKAHSTHIKNSFADCLGVRRYRKVQRKELQCVGPCISIYTVVFAGFLALCDTAAPPDSLQNYFLYEGPLDSYKKIVLQTVTGCGGIAKFNEKSSNV